MRLIIILLITIHICINNLFGQVNTDSLLFNCELKYYNATNTEEKNKYLFEKANIYIEHNYNFFMLNKELNRINWQEVKDTVLLKKFFWNKSISEFFNTKYNVALNDINHLKELGDSTLLLNEQLLEILILLNVDSILANAAIKKFAVHDALIYELDCFYKGFDYEKKGKILYLMSSAIVPGSGMYMLNYFFKGTAALTLNTLSVYAVYSLLQNNLYFNSVIWGIVLAQKFYAGNIKLTEKLYNERETEMKLHISEECKHKMLSLLNKYKIAYIKF